MNNSFILLKILARKMLKKILNTIYFISIYGFQFNCPVCKGNFRKLLPFGVKLRPNARCPGCGSLERHRLLWLYLKNKTNFFTNNLRVFEIAPYSCLQNKFIKMDNLEYLSADIVSSIAMVKMDITDIKLADNQFDCIICYHVLEHIIDDTKAMKELFRVLKPGGWAIIQSPINHNDEKTYEDSRIILPEEREKYFGQKDHVRIYGSDYLKRLEKVGFIVKLDNYVKKLPVDAINKYGLDKNEYIVFCTKQEY
jgi:SAM-dependent methyltransferase